jgi:FkbM family methyltransferase
VSTKKALITCGEGDDSELGIKASAFWLLTSFSQIVYKVGTKIFSGRVIGKFYPVKVANNLISYIVSCLKLNIVEVLGHKMLVHPKDFFSSRKAYGLQELELEKKLIKKGDVVLVIGAYIGYFTLIFAKFVGKEGKVFAFEPEPTNFSLLEKNMEINGYKNVVLVQKAVSNKTEKIKLYISEIGSTDHRIYDLHNSRRFIEIESIRLDDYFKDYDGKIDFIKMDIQGAEPRAVQGMSVLLNKNKNVKIATEFSPVLLKKSGIKPEEYLKSLMQHGFKLYDINEQEKKIKLANISELLETYTPENGNYTNLLCVKDFDW